MPKQEYEAEFREFASANLEKLRRFAYLLCGDWHRSEDVLQTALTKLYLAWPRISRVPVNAYARRVVVTAVADYKRRAWFRREHSTEFLPERHVEAEDGADRLMVLAALAKLPTRQRATVVLRYWEDQSVEQTALIMRCSTGTVKSQTARGLQTLRGLLADSHTTQAEGILR